jgi:hypothetical protein
MLLVIVFHKIFTCFKSNNVSFFINNKIGKLRAKLFNIKNKDSLWYIVQVNIKSNVSINF